MILRFLLGILICVVILMLLPSAAFMVGILAYVINMVMQ